MWRKKYKSWNAAGRGVSRVFNVFWCVEEEKVESRLRGVRFSASLERGTGERNGFLFLSPSREICARVCERVYEPVAWTSDVQRASVTRERRHCCTFPQNPFAGENTREWVRSFLSVECCSTSSISATIPEAPRLLLLNGYSCFWKDPLAREMNGVAGQQAAPSFIILILFCFRKMCNVSRYRIAMKYTYRIYRDEVSYICFVLLL